MIINHTRLKALLGIPHNLKIDFKNKELRKDLSRQIIKQIIEARRNNDDSKAAELSQAKEFLKTVSHGICKDCKKVCSKDSTRCSVCYPASRHKKELMT